MPIHWKIDDDLADRADRIREEFAYMPMRFDTKPWSKKRSRAAEWWSKVKWFVTGRVKRWMWNRTIDRAERLADRPDLYERALVKMPAAMRVAACERRRVRIEGAKKAVK